MVTTVAANAQHATSFDPDLKSSALWRLKLYAPKQEAMARFTDLDSALPETQLVTDPDATMVLLPKFVPLLAGTEVLPCILGSATVGSARLIQVCKEQWGNRPPIVRDCQLRRQGRSASDYRCQSVSPRGSTWCRSTRNL